jgi:hypothetical protein
MAIRDKIGQEITRVRREELAEGAVEAEAVLGVADRRLPDLAHGREVYGQEVVTFVVETTYKLRDNRSG